MFNFEERDIKRQVFEHESSTAWWDQVERGNHEALLSSGSSYSGMWKRQAAGIMEDPEDAWVSSRLFLQGEVNSS